MPEEGVVVTWTRLYEPMKGFEDQVPLTLAIIRLTNGVRVLAQIADDQGNLAIGDRVRLTLRKIRAEGEDGPIFYGYKFVKE
jgi:hypothetical protein